jgi:hypothetical protein
LLPHCSLFSLREPGASVCPRTRLQHSGRAAAAADARAHRPAGQPGGRVGDQQGFQPRLVGRFLAPAIPAMPSGARIAGIRLWSAAHSSFDSVVMIAKLSTRSPGGKRQDSPNPAMPISRRLARSRRAACRCRSFPFIRGVERHQTAPLPERLRESRFRVDVLAPGVEGREADLDVLGLKTRSSFEAARIWWNGRSLTRLAARAVLYFGYDKTAL